MNGFVIIDSLYTVFNTTNQVVNLYNAILQPCNYGDTRYFRWWDVEQKICTGGTQRVRQYLDRQCFRLEPFFRLMEMGGEGNESWKREGVGQDLKAG